jgi:hypothetical protein
VVAGEEGEAAAAAAGRYTRSSPSTTWTKSPLSSPINGLTRTATRIFSPPRPPRMVFFLGAKEKNVARLDLSAAAV